MATKPERGARITLKRESWKERRGGASCRATASEAALPRTRISRLASDSSAGADPAADILFVAGRQLKLAFFAKANGTAASDAFLAEAILTLWLPSSDSLIAFARVLHLHCWALITVLLPVCTWAIDNATLKSRTGLQARDIMTFHLNDAALT
eukprot:6175977-Pleurochrysis_carterae.AAC.1